MAQIQDTSKKADEVFEEIDTMPEFVGGMQGLSRFIEKTLVYPKEEKNAKIGGKVFLKFIIKEDGKVKDIVVVKSSNNENLDKEAIRVVSVMPNWNPAKLKGRAVPIYFNLPINFRP